MRGLCHSLTPCSASLARNPSGGRRPLGQTHGEHPAGGADELCSILRVHPITNDPERGVAVEIEVAHEIGNGAVHVAASAGTEPAKEGMKAVQAVARTLFHAVS